MQSDLNQKRRTIIHYVIAAGLFALYGVQVCPFTDALDRTQLIIQISILFTLMLILRLQISRRVQQQAISRRAGSIMRLEFSLFLGAGILYGLFNYIVNDFPLLSALKILTGMTSLGFFISLEQTIYFQLALSKKLAEEKRQMELEKNAWSLITKFSFFATVQSLLIFFVLFLVIVKDLEWLSNVGNSLSKENAQLYVMLEIGFVSAVMLAYTLKIIILYGHNQRFLIANQDLALQAVADGRRDVRVPVTSNDELGRIASLTNHMVGELSRREKDVSNISDVTILSLASLAEARDNETGAHILRTQHYVKVLAEHLQSHIDFEDALDDHTVDLLFKSSPLHDIGKVGIPDNILLKPGKLTSDEFEIMKQHAQIGSDALASAEKKLSSNSFLRYAREIAETHHEKWDGSGYPRGLAKNDIPLSGRLMALADVYDALITKRVYKPAFSHLKAKEIIIEGQGKHFDPHIVDAFLDCEDKFKTIAETYRDNK